MYSIAGSCPAPMAVGETVSRKSTSLLLIKNLLGGTLISQSSGDSVMSELVKSSYPVYWDDPTHPNTLHYSTIFPHTISVRTFYI